MGTAIAAQPAHVPCPTCGGPTWDERKSKFWDPAKNRPTHKCRDKACGGVVWLKSEVTTEPPVAPAPRPVAAPVPANSSAVAAAVAVADCETRYLARVERVAARLSALALANPQTFPTPTFADVQAVVATITIQESRDAQGGR